MWLTRPALYCLSSLQMVRRKGNTLHLGNYRHQTIIFGAKTALVFPRKTIFSSNQGNKSHQEEQIPMSENTEKMGNPKRQYWLLKTEPGEWSWDDQASNGGKSKWDGVKNKQAQKNMKAMKMGDLCFFYHSGSKSRRVVGVVTVVKEWYDDEDVGGGAGAVDVEAVGEMRSPVDLAEMKADERMKKAEFGLFRQPRLSVVPVPEEVWERVCEMGGGFEGDGAVVEENDRLEPEG